MCLEDVVPVEACRPQPFHGGMKSDHGSCHIVPGRVGIEAAVDGMSMSDERGEPAWIWPCSRGRDAKAPRVDRPAVDGINGELTEDDV